MPQTNPTENQYHVDPQKKEPFGGAARFSSKVRELVGAGPASERPLVLFSGDLFNPSVESSITRGRHMVPIVNALGVEVACYGNHDFDFGVPALIELASGCAFPWLLTNVFDGTTGQPLAQGKAYHIIERFGLRIGLLGLVEREWLDTIPALPPHVEYRDFVTECEAWLDRLYSTEHACDVVIALTHMRLPNDQRLRDAIPADRLPLILGGHDHLYSVDETEVEATEGVGAPPRTWRSSDIRIVKSGCDFREVSAIELCVGREVVVTRHVIDGRTVPDAALDAALAETRSLIAGTIDRRVAITETALEGRSDIVRRRESNLGSFCADLIRLTYNADVVLLCGGTIRGDAVTDPGPLTVRDILDVFPFEDPCVVKVLRGRDILDALENGVSCAPARAEGRFPQVSGVRFTYDSRLPPGSRIVDCWIVRSGAESPLASGGTSSSPPSPSSHALERIDPDDEYTVATRAYLAQGNDGFAPLLRGRFIVDEENGLLISTIIRRFFLGAKYVNVLLEGTLPGRGTAAVQHAAAKFRRLSRSYVRKCLACSRQAASERFLPVIAPTVDGRIHDLGESA